MPHTGVRTGCLEAYEDPEGAPLRVPRCVWNSFMGCMWKAGPQLCWHPSVRSCVLSQSTCPGFLCLVLWHSGGTRWAHPPAHKVLATFLQLIYCSVLQGVVWGCGMTDLCKSSCRAKCLLVPCAFVFLKVFALVRLGLKIHFKVDII